MNDIRQLKIIKNLYLLVSILFCGAGIFFIVKPDCSIRFVCIQMGIMLIVYGAIKIAGYFSRDAYKLAFQYDLAFGVLFVITGIIIIARKDVLINLLFAVFGILILADALFKIQMSIDARNFGLSLWWRILIMALLTGGVGFLVFLKPFETAETMMVLIGISILLEGLLNLCVGVYTIKVIERRSSYIDDSSGF
nr:DUF308 domain-containing protein [uncultured Blautia sp.]